MASCSPRPAGTCPLPEAVAASAHSVACSLALASHGVISAAGLNGSDREITNGEYCNDFSHEFVPNVVRNDG